MHFLTNLARNSPNKHFPLIFQDAGPRCSVNAYQHITDRIIRAIETEGLAPWKKPWRTDSPRNVRGNVYRGINRLVLSIQPYADPRWLTFKQVSELGGHVRRGEHGTPVMFWKEVEEERGSETQKRMVARYYYVFNVEQTEGLDLEPPTKGLDDSVCSSVASLAEIMCPSVEVHRKGTAAYYSPSEDVVVMPREELFTTFEDFEQTLAHELVHATGHSTRLARKEVCDPIQFGSDPYAREELVAELGAAFLTNELGIASDLQQSASYVSGWLKALKNDKSLIVKAASSAQAAVDFILAPMAGSVA
jgi:antirestriction protein ArdC